MYVYSTIILMSGSLLKLMQAHVSCFFLHAAHAGFKDSVDEIELNLHVKRECR